MNKFDKYREFGDMHYRRRDRGNKVAFGLIIVCVGILLMVKKLGLLYFSWHLTWPLVLIIVGLAIGVKNRFRNNSWWILTLIGGANLIPSVHIYNDVYTRDLAVPALVIIGGLAMIFNSRKKNNCSRKMETVTTNESMLNVDVTFGGRKEIVTSKEFKGGHINATFGGAEVNLVQADSNVQPMIIDMKVSFGGVELIVPSHWEIQNQIEPTFGSVEDHRTMNTAHVAGQEKKVLMLKGSCSFGSVEIKSY